MGTGTIAWLVANGVGLIVLVVVLAGWARVQPHNRRLVMAGTACVLGVGTMLPLLLTPAQIPTGWITVLHEGRGVRNIRQLYGLTVHAGAGFYCLIEWLSNHGPVTLPAVVRFNVCLAVVNALLFFFLAVYVLRSWWASLAFLVGYAGNLNTLHAAFSETPAVLWTTYFWLGCVAAAVIHKAHTTAGLRRLALFCLAVFAALAMLLRNELLVVGGPAVAAGLAKELGWDTSVRRAAQGVGQLLRSIIAGPLPIFLLVTAALVAIGFLPWVGHLSYAIEGIAPLSLSFLLLPQKLGVFLPFGFIALFVLGMIHATRHWLSFFLLPISFVVLFKIYAAATQGMLESFRYLTFLTPVVFFVALFGFRELSDWARRWAWPPWWKRPAVVLLALSMTAWQPLGPREIFGRRHDLPGLATAVPLLGRNQQTEVRYLLDLVTRYPHCAFLTKTTWDEATLDRPTRYRWSVFGGVVPYYQEKLHEGETPEQAATELARGASCVLFYRGLDCDLLDTDGCRPETNGRAALEERVLENLPYSDISSYGAHRAEIRLGVYPVVQAPAPAP